MVTDRETLEAALVGLEARRREVDERIADVQARLKGHSAVTQIREAKPAKRKMSAEGKARIIAAAKKRWAKIRAEKKAKGKGKAKPAAKSKPAAKKRGKKESAEPVQEVA